MQNLADREIDCGHATIDVVSIFAIMNRWTPADATTGAVRRKSSAAHQE